MRTPLACFVVCLGVPTVAVFGGPPAATSFADRATAVIDVVLQKHIDPPARQQMILEGTRAVYRAAGQSLPQNTGRKVSGIATDAELGAYLKELQSRFDGKLKTEPVFLAGMLHALPGGARLVAAEERKVQGQLNANRYVGTGIVLRTNRDAGLPSIPRAFYKGPAWKAGVKSGDLILAIDGKSMKDTPLGEVVRLLRGEKGSVVEMKVRQPNSKTVRTLKITRDVAFIPTVDGYRQLSEAKWQYRLDGAKRLAYVRINRFASSTLHEVRQVERQLRGQPVAGIILDLRYGGGTLHDIVMLADALTDSGTIGRVRSGDKVKTYTSDRDALFARLPMAVLVDRTTTSGHEFLAAALQDNRKAIVVGEPTPGDGFVRSYVEVPGWNQALIIATGELQRADGTSLRKPRVPVAVPRVAHAANARRPGGVVPDVRVSISPKRRAELVRAYSSTTPGLRGPADDPLIEQAAKSLNARLDRIGAKNGKPTKSEG